MAKIFVNTFRGHNTIRKDSSVTVVTIVTIKNSPIKGI